MSSSVKVKLRNTSLKFGDDLETSTLFLNKYGHVGLGELPPDDIIWIPHSKSTFIAGFATQWPSDIYYRLHQNPETTWKRKFPDSNFKPAELLIMTYKTPENQPSLNAIDYQMVLAFDNQSRVAMAIKYVRLDAEYGFTGINIQECHSELWSSSLAMNLETRNEEGINSTGYVVKDELNFGCDAYRKTGFFPFGGSLDSMEVSKPPVTLFLNEEIYLFDRDVEVNAIKINEHGSIIEPTQSSPRNAALHIFKSNETSTSKWRLGNTFFYRQTNDTRILESITDFFRTNASVEFKPKSAVIITAAPVFSDVYQIVLASNDSMTYALINFNHIGTDDAGMFGLHNPYCQQNRFQSMFKTSIELTRNNSRQITNTEASGLWLFVMVDSYCERAKQSTRAPVPTHPSRPPHRSTTQRGTNGYSVPPRITKITRPGLTRGKKIDGKPHENEGSSKVNNMGIIIGASVGIPTLFIICIMVFVIYLRRKQPNPMATNDVSFKNGNVHVQA
ncbi:uncharacterized protein [Clytia hemisphaerica]